MSLSFKLFAAAATLVALSGCGKVQEIIASVSGSESKAESKQKAGGDEAKGEAAESKGAEQPEAKQPEAKAAEAKQPEAKTAEAEPAPTPETEAAPAAAEQPCIVGLWDATDYTAAVRSGIRKSDLDGVKFVGWSGKIGYLVEPATDGAGTVKATAKKLTHRFAGKVQGIKITARHTLDGEVVAQYQLADPNQITIAKPTENTLKSRANAKAKGFARFNKVVKVPYEFEGEYVFECSETELKVWRKGYETKRKPLTFKRGDPSTGSG